MLINKMIAVQSANTWLAANGTNGQIATDEYADLLDASYDGAGDLVASAADIDGDGSLTSNEVASIFFAAEQNGGADAFFNQVVNSALMPIGAHWLAQEINEFY